MVWWLYFSGKPGGQEKDLKSRSRISTVGIREGAVGLTPGRPMPKGLLSSLWNLVALFLPVCPNLKEFSGQSTQGRGTVRICRGGGLWGISSA